MLTLLACRTSEAASLVRQGLMAHRVPINRMTVTSSEQRAALGPEPAFGGPEAGADALDQTPESHRVIRLAHVHQLVQQYVLADGRRHLDQTEVERDVAAARARPPPRSLVPHGDPADRDPVLCRERVQRRHDLGVRQRAQVALDRRTDIAGLSRQSLTRSIAVDDLAAAASRRVDADDDHGRAAQQNRRAVGPRAWAVRRLRTRARSRATHAAC